MFEIPTKLRKNIEDDWGSYGEDWLETLPSLIDQCTDLWQLTLMKESFELSYNYVTAVLQADDTPAVLKIGIPNNELRNEIHALRAFNGRASVKLLKSDETLGALLLERITPGTPLTNLQRQSDLHATQIAAGLLRHFPVPVPSDANFPTIVDWAQAFTRTREIADSPLPTTLIDKAEYLLSELNRNSSTNMLLHGDLHHENILLDNRHGWLAIDPKGVIGDPLFNAARFLNDPRPELIKLDSPELATERRLEILASEFETEPHILAAWAFVDCILSACWYIESGGETINYSLRCAEIFDKFLE